MAATTFNSPFVAKGESGHHPAALRNRTVILEKLRGLLAADREGHVLEIGSSTGAHLEVLAPAFVRLTFHPTERVTPIEARSFASSGKLTDPSEVPDELVALDYLGKTFPNVLPAVALDLFTPFEQWDPSILKFKGEFSLVFLVNVLHFTGTQGIRAVAYAAGQLLQRGGLVVIYGPFRFAGQAVQSNEDFDAMLKGQNPAFGLVDADDVVRIGASNGLGLAHIIQMPANNALIILARV